MERRAFLTAAGRGAAGVGLSRVVSARRPPSKARVVMTVRGEVDAARLGPTLMHEHVMVDFVGADRVSRDRYEADEVYRVALPFLRQAQALGCRTFVECTPAYLGRDPALLRRLSVATGLHLVTNTGYYGAARDKHVPAHAYRESAEALAARWISEFREGIEGTGIRPGMIKIGVDAGPLSEIDGKLVRAAALTHRATGLVIGSHTGDGVAAFAQLDLLAQLNVPAGAFIWIHAQNEKSGAKHIEAAQRGAWVEFDGVSAATHEAHLGFVRGMAEAGLLGRVLVSMDAGWYHVGEPGGGRFRGYEDLFQRFLPALRATLGARSVRQILTGNPARALTLDLSQKTGNPGR